MFIQKNLTNPSLKLIDKLLTSRPIYILGCNDFATSVAKCLKIEGFIDDFTTNKVYFNKKIFKTKDIPKNAIVIVAAVGIRPISAINKLKEYNLKHIDYFTLLKYSNLNLLPIPFIENFENDFNRNKDKYKKVYNLLADSESKKQFMKLLKFKINYNLKYMKGFKNIPEQQYFENFLKIKEKEVFVDIGGYDGSTTYNFIKHCPNYEKIYFFEPEKHNMLIAKKSLKPFNNIIYYQLGLSDRKGFLNFSPKGSSSKIDKDGTQKIQVEKLDNIIKDKITYIKMDVEGSELVVIKGAKNLIKKYKPKLAISVYHKSSDIWEIPLAILNIVPNYKLYLRHYTEGVTETVMYFVYK